MSRVSILLMLRWSREVGTEDQQCIYGASHFHKTVIIKIAEKEVHERCGQNRACQQYTIPSMLTHTVLDSCGFMGGAGFNMTALW